MLRWSSFRLDILPLGKGAYAVIAPRKGQNATRIENILLKLALKSIFVSQNFVPFDVVRHLAAVILSYEEFNCALRSSNDLIVAIKWRNWCPIFKTCLLEYHFLEAAFSFAVLVACLRKLFLVALCERLSERTTENSNFIL